MVSSDIRHEGISHAHGGMNEEAGVNGEELEKYFINSIVPLYPDVKDKPGKRYVKHSFISFSSFITHFLFYFI